MRNSVVLGSKKVIISLSFVGKLFPLLKDFTKMATIKGICPIVEAKIINTEPKIYFQNLFSGKNPFSINMYWYNFVSTKLTLFFKYQLLCKKK
jgi:hypothetical protein